MEKRSSRLVSAVTVVVFVVAFVLFLTGGDDGGDTAVDTQASVLENPQTQTATTSANGEPLAGGSSDQVSDLPPIRAGELPAEAVDTLGLIATQGPFPFDRDGAPFENREGLLPQRDSGYYSEYTVITPGSPDRGARRIVGGSDGERYYTADHYDSFREIVVGADP